MRSIATNSQRRSLRQRFRDWTADSRGIAATEFAFVVPLMLVLFFGTVEFCSAIAINRKVTLMARTLSDLTSQAAQVGDSDMKDFFTAVNSILWPYPAGALNPYPSAPMSGTVSQLYVDPNTHKATVTWSKGTAPIPVGTQVSTVPTALLIDKTYLIYSQVSYKYTPTVGYVMTQALTLSDVAYTRPRQSVCVLYTNVYNICS